MVKEFENDPRVVTALMNMAEPEVVFQRYWSNVYLRGQMLHDPETSIAGIAYQQPNTGLPVERAFILGQDQTVVLPFFSYKPQLMIDTIYDLLAAMPDVGDMNCDGTVDGGDVEAFILAVMDPDQYAISYPGCYLFLADTDASGVVDPADIASFVELLLAG